LRPRVPAPWYSFDQEWAPLYGNEHVDLPAGALDRDKAYAGDRCLTSWGRAVLNYRRQRRRHDVVRRNASIGCWALQCSQVVLTGGTPFLVVLSPYPNLVKAIPASIGTLLTIINARVNWRGLAEARRQAVCRMDREFLRFDGGRHDYSNLDADDAVGRFCDEIERINEEAEKASWLEPSFDRSTARDNHEPGPTSSGA
jgi:hypothetical protein